MRRTVAIVGALVLGVVASAPTPANAAPAAAPGPSRAEVAALAAGLPVAAKAAVGQAPTGANPYVSLLPTPAKVDYATWARWLAAQGPKRAQQRSGPQAQRSGPQAQQRAALAASPLLADEDEPVGTRGANETTAAAQLVRGFGTAAGQNPKLRILGGLSPQLAIPIAVPANAEDDGSITLAGATGIGTTRSGVIAQAEIGDGPHGGTGTGDFDFYRVDATAGELITVDTDVPTGGLDTSVVLYDATGAVVAANDDNGTETASLLRVNAPSTGAYYAVVAGYGNIPADPFDPASGDGTGSQGAYSVTISVTADDHDVFAVKLRKGDVIGASIKGAATRIGVRDTASVLVQGSDQDATYLYPEDSPLPGGGNAVIDHVAEKAGWHYLDVAGGAGSYDITVEVYRAPLESAKPVQTLFLDFDGARLNTAVFGGPGVRQLSPLAAFLARWGLTRADEDAVIDVLTARVEENLKQDLADSGLNNRFRIKVTNSRDHADTFGKANVSRVVVGGTTGEAGVTAVGVAQSIDPGNFDTTETALVLLDLLSNPTGDVSLNSYLKAESNRVAFVGTALGNLVSQQAAHGFGNWHVDAFDDRPDLMDQGGNFPVLYGVGPDGVGGTGDDVDVDFGQGSFDPTEGFTGTQNTLGRVAFGVTS